MASPEKPDPKWKRFERAIHQIHEQFAPTNATVKYDDLIMGEDSHTERQIDVSIRVPISGYNILIAVECKDHKTPIDVEDMGAFANKVRDVRASKGVMVSASGFTPAARNMAKTHGIDLRTYLDTESTDWPQEVSVPMLLERVNPYQWSFIFSNAPGNHRFMIPTTTPFNELQVESEAAVSLGSLLEVLGRKWNAKEIPHQAGEHTILLGDHLIDRMGDETGHFRAQAIVRVRIQHYLGPLPIRVRGLVDVETGAITTNELATDSIEPAKIERGEVPGWNEINIAELSIRPTFRLNYSDVLPDGRPETAG